MPPTTLRSSDNSILTEDHKNIIRLLVENHTLTTSQIWEELPRQKSIQQVRRDLNKLKELKMVSAFEILSHRPGANEAGWMLEIRGASAIRAKYDSRYSRKPGPQKLAIKAQKLELKGQVMKVAGWELMLPVTYNSSRPKPENTSQSKLLLEAYGRKLYQDLKERRERTPNAPGLNEDVKAFNVGMYSSLVPKGANDWLAYRDLVSPQDQRIQRVVAVLILCPNQATSRFWQQRIKMYQKIATKIAILGVFSNVEEANGQEKLLKKAGLDVVLLPKVNLVLTALEENDSNEK